MTKINIMVTRHSAFYSPLIATITAGFLKAEGLQASYTIATPGESVHDRIRSGSVHLGQSAVSVSWGPMERGESVDDLAHFAQINERDGFFLAGRRPDPDFKWTTLIGSTVVADHGVQPLAMFKYALHKAGIDPAQLTLIDAGDVDAMDRAFRAGRGDYIHQQGPAPQQLEKHEIGYVLASVGEIIGPIAFSSLVAPRAWLAGDMAKAFMRAYRRARRYVNDTPAQEIARVQAGLFKNVDRDVLTRTIARYQGLGCWNPRLEISPDGYNAALDVFLHNGIISKRHPYHSVVVSPPADDD